MTGFAKACWAAYARQEEVTARLNQQLRTQGIYSDGLSRSLQKIASNIQRVTTVGDEDTLAMMQLGLSMGVTADKMEEATKQAIGLSKAYGVDMNSAMKMVALAGQGEYTMLQRYIPQLRSMTTEAEKAAAVKKLLADGFKIATAEADTAGGKLKQLANRWGDIQEAIAERALPAIQLVLKWIEAAIVRVDALVWTWDKLFRTDEITLAKKELERLNSELESTNISMASLSRYNAEGSEAFKAHAANAKKLAEDVDKAKVALDKLTTAPKRTLPALPGADMGGGKISEEEAKKQAESRLKNVDQWYLSTKGAAETSYLQFRYGEQGAWDQLSLEQKEALMTRAQEIYARDNATMSGSFMQSLDRMKSAGMGWAQAWDGMWAQTTSGMATNIQTFLTASGSMFQNFKKLLDGIFKSILSSFISMVSQMIAKWLVLNALTGGGVSFFGPKILGSLSKGGPISETGPYLLHKGEEVIPADIANSVRNSPAPSFTPTVAGASEGPDITVSQNITIGGTSETDISVIADKLSKATKAGVLAAVDLAKVNYKVGLKRAEETSI